MYVFVCVFLCGCVCVCVDCVVRVPCVGVYFFLLASIRVRVFVVSACLCVSARIS